MHFFDTTQTEIRRAWKSSPPLAATVLLMIAALAVSLLGLRFDSRIITGVPAWLKPAKFAISTAIFAATMTWLFRYVVVWPRFVRFLGWSLAVSLVTEVSIIYLQAARGTTSHFNVGTPLDAALFAVMGLFILALLLSSAGVLVALFRQEFANPDWGWALRLGMLVTVLGSGSGGLMLRPAPGQLTRQISRPLAVGGHTVGAPDGGEGLAGVGWSARHGDLRVPHFLGLHGIQLIPLASLLLARRRPFNLRQRIRLAVLAGASYFSLFVILLWQAFRGQSIAQPDTVTLAALGLWLILSFGCYVLIAGQRFRRFDRASTPASANTMF